jgi:hypothetical protein
MRSVDPHLTPPLLPLPGSLDWLHDLLIGAIEAMPKSLAKEALEREGKSAAQIDRELRTFREAARVLSSDHPRMIDEHPSRWIGVYDGRVAASGRSLKSLLERLKKKRIPRDQTIIRFIDRQERMLIL